MKREMFNFKSFIIITLITSIWINISEVFRYFAFVMPRTIAFHKAKEGVAEMSFSIFTIWGLWDTLLTAMLVFVFWLYARVFGNNMRSVFGATTIVWLTVFVIFWVATANMGLADWNILFITLPLAWLEMFIAAWIVSRLYRKELNTNTSFLTSHS